MQLTKELYDEFYNFSSEIINLPVYQKMKGFIQHGKTSCYEHSINVALNCFLYAKKHKIDYSSLVRGALLHDFFLYDWHDKNKGFRFHGYKHPRFAYNNAIAYFELNDTEKDIILKHMFPLTLTKIPKTRESWIVSFIDKKCSLQEIFNVKSCELKIV